MTKYLITLALSALVALGADIPKEPPTNPTPEEMVTFQSVAIRFYQARIKLLEDLIGDKLGLAAQREARTAEETLNAAVSEFQKKHNAVGCALTGEAKWDCSKGSQ